MRVVSVPTLDFIERLKDLPRGAWVAISVDHASVTCYGSDLSKVLADAKKLGELVPLIIRVPEDSTTAVL